MHESVERLADHNLALAMRRHSAWQRGARLEDAGGALLHRSALGLPLLFHNCMLRHDAAADPLDVLRRAEDFFAPEQPFIVLTQGAADADLEACLAGNGFVQKGDSPAMLVEQAVQLPALAPGWKLDWVTTPAGVADFSQVCAGAYATLGLPAAVTPSYFADPQAILADRAALVLARNAQGTAAACALVLLDGDAAGIYWVGALPEHRGARLAHACTAAATNRAFDEGARAVVLQATPMGEPLYLRMGYREYGRVRRWSRPA